jgi:quinolinate synthase
VNLLTLESVPALQSEVRALAAQRGAVILAHNYQLPEVQDVADFVGDSLGLSQQAAATGADVIAFCGVHFMAETASVLSPEKTVLLPDMDAGCSLADSITAAQLRAWKGKHPGADFLIHPECGCSTSVMEYVAAGDVDAEGVHMLSTGGMLGWAASAPAGTTAIMATETGMLYPLQMAAPDVDFIPANRAAACRYMKMITLTKLRDALRDLKYEVKVPEGIAAKARIPIERMVAIG